MTLLPELVEHLLDGIGADWPPLIFFLDNGLTATRVAFKIAMRTRHVDAPHRKHLSGRSSDSKAVMTMTFLVS